MRPPRRPFCVGAHPARRSAWWRSCGQCLADSRMMKQVLLDVTGVAPKPAMRDPLELKNRGFPLVHGAEDSLDPDINRHGVKALVGEQQYAVRDLSSHARQLTKEFARLVRRFLP